MPFHAVQDQCLLYYGSNARDDLLSPTTRSSICRGGSFINADRDRPSRQRDQSKPNHGLHSGAVRSNQSAVKTRDATAGSSLFHQPETDRRRQRPLNAAVAIGIDMQSMSKPLTNWHHVFACVVYSADACLGCSAATACMIQMPQQNAVCGLHTPDTDPRFV